jgi:hypothetical protein
MMSHSSHRLVLLGLWASLSLSMSGCMLFGGDSDESSDSESSSSTAPTTAEVKSIALSVSGTPTALKCFALTATGIGATGAAVSSDQDVIFDLSAAVGSGTFYSNSTCSTSITSATLAQGQSTKQVYFKTLVPQTIQLQATYHAVTGTTWGATLYGPPVASIALAHTQHTDCSPFSLYLVDSSSSTMVESSTDPTIVTLTQTSGAGTMAFYTSAGCSSGLITSGTTTTATIPAGSTNLTVYILTNGNGGQYTLTGSWSCTTTSTSIVTSGSGYSLSFTY